MSKFTPGPWKTLEVMDKQNNPCGYSIWEEREKKYPDEPLPYKICQTPDGTTVTNKANANVIAIAPDMYKFLSDLTKYPESIDSMQFMGLKEAAWKIIKGVK